MAKLVKQHLENIEPGFIIPSALSAVPKGEFALLGGYNQKPVVGDVVLCRVTSIAQHVSLENTNGRVHNLHNGSEFIGVFGNRYAPDQFEAVVPTKTKKIVDLFSWGGLVGQVLHKNDAMREPTQVEVLGYVYNKKGQKVNTLNYQLVKANLKQPTTPRSPLILVCGTAMNSGKSTAAAAIISALKSAGYKVRASKVTGTASLKDILHMNDAGAHLYSDFTYLGYPSTYLLDEKELVTIFNSLDLRYANKPENFWVVEFADGISQRETAILLQNKIVRNRISKLVFCAADTFGALGGVDMLRKKFNLEPDAISGVCTSSPLFMQEIDSLLNIPVFNNRSIDKKQILKVLKVKKNKN